MPATEFLDNLVGPIVHFLSATKTQKTPLKKGAFVVLFLFHTSPLAPLSRVFLFSIKSSLHPSHLPLRHHHQQQQQQHQPTSHLPTFTSKSSTSYPSSQAFTKQTNFPFDKIIMSSNEIPRTPTPQPESSAGPTVPLSNSDNVEPPVAAAPAKKVSSKSHHHHHRQMNVNMLINVIRHALARRPLPKKKKPRKVGPVKTAGRRK